jgi:hypothetical protein
MGGGDGHQALVQILLQHQLHTTGTKRGTERKSEAGLKGVEGEGGPSRLGRTQSTMPLS